MLKFRLSVAAQISRSWIWSIIAWVFVQFLLVLLVAAVTGDAWTTAYYHPSKYVYLAASIMYLFCVYGISWQALRKTGLWANKLRGWVDMGWQVILVVKSMPWVGTHISHGSG
jgi:hypothetical protein